MAERRRMGIEAVLSWAYRDELPKEGRRRIGGPSDTMFAWGGIERYGELLAEIDESENFWGLVPDFTALADPHPDAVTVGLHVGALDGRGLDLPEGWNPLEDMMGLGFDELVEASVVQAIGEATVRSEDGTPMLRRPPRYLVMRQALLRDAPCWEGDVPSVVVESANGKPRWFRRIVITTESGESYEQEVDGYNKSRQRPMPGAYQKRHLDPDLVPVAVSRADYEVWRAALEVLADALSDLETIEVIRSDRAMRPWMREAGAQRRVLDSIGPVHSVDYSDVPVAAFYRKRTAPRLTRGSRLT